MVDRYHRRRDVASLAGAWIETRPFHPSSSHLQVASLAGAWIETFGDLHLYENHVGRLPRGGVDRNIACSFRPARTAVASLAGAWIETVLVWQRYASPVVASLAGAWIETSAARIKNGFHADVASLAGAWIETKK